MSAMDIDRFVLNIQLKTEIAAPPDIVFESMLEQIGPGFTKPDGEPIPMKIERFPGGRWFRDLGNNTGHLWGHVQVIKPPMLLEIIGPMFMSYAVASHIQYRVEKNGKGSVLTLTHQAIGDIKPEHRTGPIEGWKFISQQIAKRATR